jgi:hypothetical protein
VGWLIVQDSVLWVKMDVTAWYCKLVQRKLGFAATEACRSVCIFMMWVHSCLRGLRVGGCVATECKCAGVPLTVHFMAAVAAAVVAAASAALCNAALLA